MRMDLFHFHVAYVLVLDGQEGSRGPTGGFSKSKIAGSAYVDFHIWVILTKPAGEAVSSII